MGKYFSGISECAQWSKGWGARIIKVRLRGGSWNGGRVKCIVLIISIQIRSGRCRKTSPTRITCIQVDVMEKSSGLAS